MEEERKFGKLMEWWDLETRQAVKDEFKKREAGYKQKVKEVIEKYCRRKDIESSGKELFLLIEQELKKELRLDETTTCPYCGEDIEDDDEYNEHLVTKHPDEFDNQDELGI